MTLSRRNLIRWSLASGLGAFGPSPLLANGSAGAVYARGPVIDGLGFPGSMETDEHGPLNEAELAHVRESGLAATHITVGAVGTMAPLAAFEKIVRDVARWERMIDEHPDTFTRVRTAADIEAARAADRTGLIYGLQDGVAFEDDPERLPALHQIGIRIVQPTYNRRNLLGDGCMEPADAGLSRTGNAVIERLDELGFTLDLSHCGRRTAADAFAASRRPVSFTHTGCYALAEHPRHRTDDELRAAADSGGVIGIYVMPYLARGAQPTAADVIAHLEHAIQVAGEDHVAFGTDGNISPAVLTEEYREQFREMTRKRKELGIAAPFETEEGYLFANDLNTPRRFETLAGLLLERGHSEARVEKILGANLQRLFRDTWAD
ncbi:MAG: dipeptidase [Gammaproteobacteria bacterium]|nr:dipeptidase [Gammaproteobacteria bacterium]NNK33471.1 peptidase M19 [Xanthomonadales bacterium]